MSVATLAIGLGGTGVLTIRALKELYRTLPEAERIPASFLAFDFDRSALLAGDHENRFAELDEDEFFYLNPKGLQELLRNLDRGDNGGLAWEKVLKWFPDRANVQIPASEVEANGASQLRILGRLGFFLNDEVIERALRVKLNDLGAEVDASRLSEDKRVVIVSSLAGGTGAGMFIDLAYVVRRQLLRPRVFGYFLLPEVFQDVDSGGRIFQNSYACLKELAYLKDQQIPFEAEYERIAPVRVGVGAEEPFSRIFLCRGDGFAGSESIKSATTQIAESILGQLQRTLQEKTLAIASNTLSTDTQEEQLKRRTHCFSTVTSTILTLEEVSLQEVVFQRVIETLKDDTNLENLYREQIEVFFEKTAQDLDSSLEDRQAQQNRDAETSAPPQIFPSVRRLLEEWEERIVLQATATRDLLRAVAEATLSKAEATARSGKSEEDLHEPRKQIDDLHQLAPARNQLTQASKLQLSNVEEAQKALAAFDKAIGDLLTPFNPEQDLSIHQALYRKAHFSQILRHRERFLSAEPRLSDGAVKDAQTAWEERKSALGTPRWRLFGGSRTAYTDQALRLLLDCTDLRSLLENPDNQADLLTLLKARAKAIFLAQAETQQKKVGDVLQRGARAWTDLKHRPVDTQRTISHLGAVGERIELWMRKYLPRLVDQVRQEDFSDDTAEVRRNKLLEIIDRNLGEFKDLRQSHHILTIDPDHVEDYIRERLVHSRQQIFERRTPNPQRKGIALIMVPQGLIWPKGDEKKLRRFLEASASQILAARVQIEEYEGSRIWIYYEDLFNPPEHVRNIDEYFRNYSTQRFKELFHIDRRFLENPVFKDVNSRHTSIVVTCGNPGCRENLSSVPREEKICPGCGRMIRSRCGNSDCTANDLNTRPEAERNAKSCPACGGFNHAAWWCCPKHGKIPYEVPIDKDRCPLCIERHQSDPVGYPEKEISVRPDLLQTLACPHCETLAERNPRHEVFRIRHDLKSFYLHGVNGHDREKFMRLAARYQMPQNVRCPSCRTILIPVHHQKMNPPACGGRPVQ